MVVEVDGEEERSTLVGKKAKSMLDGWFVDDFEGMKPFWEGEEGGSVSSR